MTPDPDLGSRGKSSVNQRTRHHHRVFTSTHRRVVIATAPDFIETITLIQAESRPIAVAYFKETFPSLGRMGPRHQVLKQAQAQAAALALRLDRDIEQVRFIENDLHHAMPDLLAAFEHQPDLVLAQAIEENPAGPGMAERRVFDLQDRIQVRLGHRAKTYRITHRYFSIAPSAGAWLARHQPCAVAHPSIIPDRAAPRPIPGLRPAVHGCTIRHWPHRQNAPPASRSATGRHTRLLPGGPGRSPGQSPVPRPGPDRGYRAPAAASAPARRRSAGCPAARRRAACP